MPALVVAPINVNFGRSKRIDRAAAPFPITISITKSSIAGYNTSSTWRFNRWISSTNSTSPSCRLLRIAAISPGFSMAGPAVIFRFVPISFATIPASVVLPSPGGPYNSTWSKESPRSLAASIYTLRLLFTFSCPIYSRRYCGLRLVSIPASSFVNSVVMLLFAIRY